MTCCHSPHSCACRNLRMKYDGFQGPSDVVVKAWCGKCETSSEGESMSSEKLQHLMWHGLFTSSSFWWDNRRSWVEWQLRSRGIGQSMEFESIYALPDACLYLEAELSIKPCQDGRSTDAMDALTVLVQRGCHVPSGLLYRALKRCIEHGDIVLGRRVHALAEDCGYEGDAFLATHLIRLYASYGRLEEAMRVFTKVSSPDAYNWASIIFAYARHGEASQALQLYAQMRASNVTPDDHVYIAVSRACAIAGDLVAGKQLHAQIVASQRKPHVHVERGLLLMYVKCGSLEDACRIFARLPHRDVVTWNALIAGYVQQGMGEQALSLYSRMQQDDLILPNSVTFVSLLQACASIGVAALHQGRQLHAHIEELGLPCNVILGGSLLNMYRNCGSIKDARNVFNTLSDRDVVTWSAMIAGYVEQGLGQEALDIYNDMQQEALGSPNTVTFVCLLQACACVGVGALRQGQQLHAQLKKKGLQTDVVIGCSLVNMYAKCGSITDARCVFDRLPNRNVLTWTAIIGAYVQHGMGQEALSVWSSMQQEGLSLPNSVTFGCLLQACASVGADALHEGELLHLQIEEQGLQDDTDLGCSLVNMYAKCGSLETARRVFERLPVKDVVTWTAMIAGYVHQRKGEEALVLYSSLQQEGISPTSVTFICLLQACAIAAALAVGQQLHAQIEERGMLANGGVGAALVNMYAKCGSMLNSQLVFDSLSEKSIEAWGALFSGYACQGHSEAVFSLLDRMRLEGIKPNGIMFLSVMTMCSHAGLVEKGLEFFEVMVTEFEISPTAEHYTCMIDLLGRAGCLDEALQMAKAMPFLPNEEVWHTLLSACQKWNNVEIGQQAFEFAVRLDREDGDTYVSMSDIFARAGMFEEAKKMQSQRVQWEAWNKPGQSSTDVGGVVQTCVVGDRKIYGIKCPPAGMSPPISAFRHMHNLVLQGGLRVRQHLTWKVWSGRSQATSREEGRCLADLQHLLWEDILSDPTEWWDNGWTKPTSRHLHFSHTNSRIDVTTYNRQIPGREDLKLTAWDCWRDGTLEGLSISGYSHGSDSVYGANADIIICPKRCENASITEAVEALKFLVQRGCHVHNNVFYRLLRRCIDHKNLILGRRVHALAIRSGYQGDAFLATHLIGLYASHGRLEEAMQVFTKVSTPDSYVWATIIFACAGHGEAAQALRLYQQMCESAVEPDNRVYVAVLKACAIAGDLVAGKRVHARILSSRRKSDIFVQTGLLAMYAKCGSLEDARSLFSSLPEKDLVTWNAMIAGYSQQGLGQDALDLFSLMQEEDRTSPNSATFVSLLQACASVGVGALHHGRRLHAQIEERGLQKNAVLGGSLLNMYVKCGSPKDARIVFDRLSKKDVVTWTAMIAGYADGMGQEALNLYVNMQQEGLCLPDSLTFVYVLQACASIGEEALNQGKLLHAQIAERGLQKDVILGGSLLNMYVRCGSMEGARNVFDRLANKNLVTWTTLIAGYAQHGMGEQALSLYSSMQHEGLSCPDSVTFVCLLQACATVGEEALQQGKQLHAQIEAQRLQYDVVVGSSLVNMYSKCGSLEDARSLFNRLSEKSMVTWTAMIAGYAKQGMGEEALSLYNRMQEKGLSPPDAVTVVCLLQACAIVACLPLGRQLHAEVEERGLQTDGYIGVALIDMYGKCGSMIDSQQVFDSLAEKSTETWTSLIGGYTRQGNSEVVFSLFDEMRLEGVQPNGITFLSVLTVCSHVGLVNKGRKYFELMGTDYGITATIEHYTCMIDLLGRAGLLDEALQMALSMPCRCNSAVWHTLLGACQKWSNVKVGQQAFEQATMLDVKDAASYVLMSNIYAKAEMWVQSTEMQTWRVQCGARKEPGQSWTDVGGMVHTFVVEGDRQQLGSEDFCAHYCSSFER